MQVRHAGFLAVLLLSVSLAGCGKSDDKKVATQVVAKVNADEITVHQVNTILARTPNLPAQSEARAKRQVVDRLINQRLAVQQAMEKKLDRSPEVVQAIEAAKNDILARAYLRQVAAAGAKPTPGEIQRYYAEHPELFAQRRLYVLEEISFAPRDDLGAQLRAQLPRLRSMEDIGSWLKTREVQFTVNRGARAAEQIPIEMLPRISAMKDGDLQLLEGAERLIVVRVVATKPAPVDEASAAPAIQRYLLNRRSSEAIDEEIKRLKGAAKIEYVGEFAPAGEPDKQPLPDPPQDPQRLDVEKGVRGLR